MNNAEEACICFRYIRRHVCILCPRAERIDSRSSPVSTSLHTKVKLVEPARMLRRGWGAHTLTLLSIVFGARTNKHFGPDGLTCMFLNRKLALAVRAFLHTGHSQLRCNCNDAWRRAWRKVCYEVAMADGHRRVLTLDAACVICVEFISSVRDVRFIWSMTANAAMRASDTNYPVRIRMRCHSMLPFFPDTFQLFTFVKCICSLVFRCDFPHLFPFVSFSLFAVGGRVFLTAVHCDASIFRTKRAVKDDAFLIR